MKYLYDDLEKFIFYFAQGTFIIIIKIPIFSTE